MDKWTASLRAVHSPQSTTQSTPMAPGAEWSGGDGGAWVHPLRLASDSGRDGTVEAPVADSSSQCAAAWLLGFMSPAAGFPAATRLLPGAPAPQLQHKESEWATARAMDGYGQLPSSANWKPLTANQQLTEPTTTYLLGTIRYPGT